MYISKDDLFCPMCGSELVEVKNTSWSGMTDEQFEMIKAGDYHCPYCPDPDRIFEEAYFWVKED